MQTNSRLDGYKWRRFKVGYLALSVVILVATLATMMYFNNHEECRTYSSRDVFSEARYGYPSQNVTTECLSPSDKNQEVNVAVVATVLVVLLVFGYYRLPKIYNYIKKSE